MPTYRKLHTKILDSYDFSEMPDDFTRVFWLLLIVVVDSEGRAIENPSWLRSKMFPLRSDIESQQIECTITWLQDRGLIVRYQVDGRAYFYLKNFKKYQTGTEKEAKSQLPGPPEELQSNSRETPEAVEVAASASASDPASVTEPEEKREEEKTREVEPLPSPLPPNIFTVYEEEIGMLTPMIADALDDAEKTYPPGWVEDALHEAALNNARNWKYAEACLKSWRKKGHTVSSLQQPTPVHVPQKVLVDLPNGKTLERTI
jgi:DnaD/phage-associated family protein